MTKKNLSHIIFLPFLLTVITVSCHETGLSPADFAGYCKDTRNGLVKTVTAGEYTFTVKYKPQPLMALEKIQQADPKLSLFDSVRKDYSESEYFVLKVSADSLQTEKKLHKQYNNLKYDTVMNYIRFNMQPDFYLTSGKDTMKCAGYVMDNSGGIDPALTLSLAFDNSALHGSVPKDLTFHFQDKVFQYKPLIVNIDAKSLKAIPPIQLN